MSVSDKIRGLLALSGKKQNELAERFGMTKQSMSNKFAHNAWSAADLVKVVDFCGCKLAVLMPDGQHICIDAEEKTSPEK